MALPLPAGTDEQAVTIGIAKATRQRIRRAERDGVVVLRWDAGRAELEGAVRATEDGADALRRFYGLLRATGDRRGFGFAGPEEFVPWWGRALEAGHLVYLEAREGRAGRRRARRARPVPPRTAALDRSTAATGPSGGATTRARCTSCAGARSSWPSPRAAPRWTSAGWTLPGARRIPAEGEPTYGLYEHKRSFGAEWVALAGAQERVARPWRYALGRGLSRVERLVTPGRTAR